MDKAAERYLKRLRRCLICPRADREQLLKDAGDMLENFAQENPRAFYNDYAASFGPPEDFAAEMLSSLDPEDIAEARRRRKNALTGAVFAVFALLVLLAGFWFGRQSQQPTVPPSSTAQASSEPSPEPSPEPTAEESEAPGPDEAVEAYLEQSYTDFDDIEYKEAVATLTTLGLMGGKSDGTFDPEGTITRAEATRLIALLMNGGRDLPSTLKSDPSFTDIKGHWAEVYIEYCADLGIAIGDTNGAFLPNEELTTLHLFKMALCSLGYDANAYRLNGNDWAVRTDELVRTMSYSLYEGLVDVAVSSPITRDVAAQILFNLLHATPKVVVPIHNVTDGTVSWQYEDATRDGGFPADLLWVRFALNWEDISFE